LVEVSIIVDLRVDLFVDVFAHFAENSEHIPALLRLLYQFISGLAGSNGHLSNLLDNSLVKGSFRLFQVPEHLRLIIPPVNCLLNKWQGLLEVFI
jgi:hypothetical protein